MALPVRRAAQPLSAEMAHIATAGIDEEPVPIMEGFRAGSEPELRPIVSASKRQLSLVIGEYRGLSATGVDRRCDEDADRPKIEARGHSGNLNIEPSRLNTRIGSVKGRLERSRSLGARLGKREWMERVNLLNALTESAED